MSHFLLFFFFIFFSKCFFISFFSEQGMTQRANAGHFVKEILAFPFLYFLKTSLQNKHPKKYQLQIVNP